MLLKTLKGKHYQRLFFAPFLVLLLWIKPVLNSSSLAGNEIYMPLYTLLQNLTAHNAMLLNIVGGIILVSLSFFLVHLNERHMFIDKKTALPAFVFVLLATASLQGMHPSLLASLFLLFAIDRTFVIFNSSQALTRCFEAGLFIGLATTSYLYSCLYLIWFWLALSILAHFKPREILAGLTGFILPVSITLCWYYLNGHLEILMQNAKELFIATTDLQLSFAQKTYWGILTMFVLISAIFASRILQEKKVSARKYFLILFSFLFFSVGIYILFSSSFTGLFFSGLIPSSLIISHYFVASKYSWIKEMLFVIFATVNLWMYFFK